MVILPGSQPEMLAPPPASTLAAARACAVAASAFVGRTRLSAAGAGAALSRARPSMVNEAP